MSRRSWTQYQTSAATTVVESAPICAAPTSFHSCSAPAAVSRAEISAPPAAVVSAAIF
jgi:hypothetical protein